MLRLDTIGMIVGVSEVAYVHLLSNQNTISKKSHLSRKDIRNNHISLVLWESSATDFDADTIHSIGQQSPVVAILVGMLLKSYKNKNTLSKGTTCKRYINEYIPEIESFYDWMCDNHRKIEWTSPGEQQFRALEQQMHLEEKIVLQLRDIDPWEVEGSRHRCTVAIC